MALIAGCSSSAPQTGADSHPSASAELPSQQYDANITDSIIEPVPGVISDNTEQTAADVSSEDVSDSVIEEESAALTPPDSEKEEADAVSQPYVQTAEPAEFDVRSLLFEEFDNFYGEMTYIGLPEKRTHEPLKKANGVWRYNLKNRDDASEYFMFDELGYAEMTVNGSMNPPVMIVLHPRLACDGYEVWEEDDESVGYEPFAGGFDENNNIRLFGSGSVISLTEYYAFDGKEYLIAELWISEESSFNFLMIREQEQ